MLTSRQFWLMAHLGLGVVFIHVFAGGITTLLQSRTPPAASASPRTRLYVVSRIRDVVRAISTVGLALIAWLTVISGTWIVYPWYRAKPPPGEATRFYPQAALEATQGLSVWHSFGMEWKEHVGWLAPFLATAVAFIVLRHSHLLDEDERLRKVVTTFFALSFAVAVIAGLLGAALNNVAPNEFLTR